MHEWRRRVVALAVIALAGAACTDGGEEPPPLRFVPPTTQENGRWIVPFVLPDGTTGKLEYPRQLRLVEDGITVTAGIRLADDLLPSPTRRLLLARRGAVEDVVAAIAAPNKARRTGALPGASGRTVTLWDIGRGLEVLAAHLDGWTAVVGVRGNTRPPLLDEKQQAMFASNLGGKETEDGFLVLDLGPALATDHSALIVGSPPGRRSLEYGYHVPDGGTLSIETATGCLAGDESPRAVEVDGGTASATWCSEGLRLWMEAPASARDDVMRRLEGVTAVDVRLSDWIVDRAWITEEQMRAATDGTVDRLWVAGVFYRPGTMFDANPGSIEDFAVRYRGVDLPPDVPLEVAVRRAFAALQGPPPPGLEHALQNMPLEVLDLRAEGDVVTLDFPRDLVAPTSTGSTSGIVTQAQIVAEVAHYFPEARTLCILIEGQGGFGEQDGPYLFHDGDACPIDLR